MPKIKSVFIAYRHTGEDPVKLHQMLSGVVDALNKIGIKSYCTMFNQQEFDAKSLGAREIMEHAFDEIEKNDALFVVQASNNKSEGMLMEVGRFYGVKPIIVAKHSAIVGTYLPEMATITFTWSNQTQLEDEITKVVKQVKL